MEALAVLLWVLLLEAAAPVDTQHGGRKIENTFHEGSGEGAHSIEDIGSM